ncbi:MAG: gamma-glutamyltransferase [Acidobacteria bacterium]|nr:gamma-glutamyltransferase [Acidobacteriota bacterium]
MRRLAPFLLILLMTTTMANAQRTQKPVLHGKSWMAITGKPLGATAGAKIFEKGGNAVDAAAAMIAATSTMWDTLGWGGETQALIYNPHTGKVIGINALGVAPTGATPDFFRQKGMSAPAAGAAPIHDRPVDPRPRGTREGPEPGSIFRQPDLAATLRKLVETEAEALKQGKSRKEAIYAAHDRFYKGDIAREIVRSVREQGGLFTEADLASWKVRIEEPLATSYKGIDVYKLQVWTQGPAMLQALNILEPIDLQSMGYNSARYINTVYQAMSLAFADRDFYYGDIYSGPAEPVKGLLSKEYAAARRKLIDPERNDPAIGPGDPYPFQGEKNPHLDLLKRFMATPPAPSSSSADGGSITGSSFFAGTTSVEAADAEGWVVSVTPSGGWIPAVIAGRSGVGLSQRMQSFVLEPHENPYNIVGPGRQPRVTLTPTLALKDGKPFLAFAVQGGDTQDQNLLQFFLNVVEFGMNVQEAAEAANFNSYQMRSSFGAHEIQPGRVVLNEATPDWVRRELRAMGYRLDFEERTSGPINAIWFDRAHGTFWGGASNHGEDYGIAW